ncbi:MAG: hypothetical protein RLZZ69_1614 [Cyanobacteriota bacterium]
MRDSADCPKGRREASALAYRFAYGAPTRKTLPSGVFTIFDAGNIEVLDLLHEYEFWSFKGLVLIS